jgi:VIT1/CCC1 family predicted Fe2+/Mn2+ transporter
MMKDQNYWTNHVKESAVLNPVDRISEVLFGLIMVLTFTGAISASTDAREDVRELLWAALGCNVAWGLVDAIMYLMNVAIERGHSITVIKKIHASINPDEAGKILKDEIPPGIAGLMSDKELGELSGRLKNLPVPSKKNLITGSDVWAGIQIFLLVFLCTFPVAIPFGIFDELGVAMRASNGVALLLLFIGGFVLAKYAGFRPGITAIVYTLIGVALVALTMALGG